MELSLSRRALRWRRGRRLRRPASAVLVAMGFVAVDETVRTIAKEYVNVSGGVKEKVGSGVRTEVELELSNAEEVGASIGREQQLVFVKDDIEVRFSRDVRRRHAGSA